MIEMLDKKEKNVVNDILNNYNNFYVLGQEKMEEPNWDFLKQKIEILIQKMCKIVLKNSQTKNVQINK